MSRSYEKTEDLARVFPKIVEEGGRPLEGLCQAGGKGH